MIKRTIGIIGTLIVLAVVALTILGRNNYSSAIEFGHRAQQAESSAPAPSQPAEEPTMPTDSVDIEQKVEIQ